MNFKVPKEFEDFVTNTEDLLEQIKNQSKLKSNDIVSYQIHWDNLFQYENKLEQSIELLKYVNNIIDPFVKDYIWHNEPFHLNIKISKSSIILCGQSCVDDCIEDEWFIVYLLLMITKQINYIYVNVVDSDGEFILIEASDYLEDWIGPENIINRVWLYQGKLHIIPLDEPGRLKNGGIKLDSAYKCLQTTSTSTTKSKSICSNNIQQMLYNRTLDIYPAKALAYSHSFICILPHWVSELFDSFPELLAKSINSFHNSDKDQIRQASMKTKFHELNSNIHDDLLIVRSIKLTRHLYAKLTFKNFNPSRKYHERMRRVSLSSSRKVIKAFEIGCRLTSGLECLYHNNLRDQANSKVSLPPARLCDETNSDWLELIKYLKTIKYTLDDHKLEKLKSLYQHRLLDIEESNSHYMKEYKNEMISSLIEKEIVSIQFNSNGNLKITNDQDMFNKILSNLIPVDDDAWLYMTPDELDKELQDRIAHYKLAEVPIAVNEKPELDILENSISNNSNNTSNKNMTSNNSTTSTTYNNKVISTNNELGAISSSNKAASSSDMQEIIDGMKRFLSSESDYDGISISNNHTIKEVHEVVNSSSEDGLHIDYDYLNKLLSQQCNVETINLDTTTTTTTSNNNNDNNMNNNDKELFKYFNHNDVEEFDNSSDDSDNEDNSITIDNRDYTKYGMKSNNKEEYVNNNDYIETYESQGTFTLPNIENIKNNMNINNTNKIYDIDSDDESDSYNNESDKDSDSDNSEMNEMLIKEYQNMMDKELFNASSILANTFEWTGGNNTTDDTEAGIYNDLEGNDEIDIDMTLLKNLTESQSQAIGNPFAGPLGQLMSQIGISLPIPPPMKSKNT